MLTSSDSFIECTRLELGNGQYSKENYKWLREKNDFYEAISLLPTNIKEL